MCKPSTILSKSECAISIDKIMWPPFIVSQHQVGGAAS